MNLLQPPGFFLLRGCCLKRSVSISPISWFLVGWFGAWRNSFISPASSPTESIPRLTQFIGRYISWVAQQICDRLERLHWPWNPIFRFHSPIWVETETQYVPHWRLKWYGDRWESEHNVCIILIHRSYSGKNQQGLKGWRRIQERYRPIRSTIRQVRRYSGNSALVPSSRFYCIPRDFDTSSLVCAEFCRGSFAAIENTEGRGWSFTWAIAWNTKDCDKW